MQRVPATGGPPIDHGDNYLGHGADKALDLQDVQAAAFNLGAGLIDAGFIRRGIIVGMLGGIAIPRAPTNALVTAGTKRPAAIFLRGPIAGKQDRAHIWRAAGVIQSAIQLIHGVRPEGIAHLWPVDGDAHDAILPTVCRQTVVGDVRELPKALNRAPQFLTEWIFGAVFLLLAHSAQHSGREKV